MKLLILYVHVEDMKWYNIFHFIPVEKKKFVWYFVVLNNDLLMMMMFLLIKYDYPKTVTHTHSTTLSSKLP